MMSPNKTGKSVRASAAGGVKSSTRPQPGELNETKSLADLPVCICGVYTSVDSHGGENGAIVIDAVDRKGRQFFFDLDLASLAMGQHDGLAKFAVAANLYEWLFSAKRLRALGSALLQSAEKPIYLVKRDGLHTVEVDRTKYNFYVHRGVMYPLGDESPVNIGVMLGCQYLAPASGDFDEWQESIGAHLTGNPHLLAVVLAAISSGLIRVFNLPPLILALVGFSSTGKTTAQQVAKSLYEPAKGIENCSGTANGIRVQLEQYADRPAFLDELHLAEDVEGLIKLIFLIGNGASRMTSTSDQKVSKAPALTCGLVTASEKTLEEIAASKRITLTEGVSARYIELVISGEKGIFHTVPEGMTPKQFSDHLKTMCETYAGAFWDAWIAGISDQFEQIRAWLPANLEIAEARLLEGMNITDQVMLRMVRGLAVWVCAGQVAVKLKLLQLKRGEIIDAIRLVLREHLARQRHNMTPIAEKVLKQVRDLIDRNTARFPSLSMFHRAEHSGIYGFTKGVGNDQLYLFLPGAFEDLIGANFGTQMAAQKLLDAGYLSADSDGLQRQFRLPASDDAKGLRKRFYAVKASIRFDVSSDSK